VADRCGRGPVLIAGVVIAAIGLALTMRHALIPVVLGIIVLTIGFFITHSKVPSNERAPRKKSARSMCAIPI
jgi:hypothetical protein